MAKNINHHMYQDRGSEVWYFQKKVRGREKPYKPSLGTRFVFEARCKRVVLETATSGGKYIKDNFLRSDTVSWTKHLKIDFVYVEDLINDNKISIKNALVDVIEFDKTLVVDTSAVILFDDIYEYGMIAEQYKM